MGRKIKIVFTAEVSEKLLRDDPDAATDEQVLAEARKYGEDFLENFYPCDGFALRNCVVEQVNFIP